MLLFSVRSGTIEFLIPAADDGSTMSDWMQKDFLVFEATAEAVPAYTCFFTEHACIGHVRAEDEVAAAKVITGVTGRVGRYAVLEVTIVDLGAPDPQGHDVVADVLGLPHRAP
jgi:hypothetical protein